MPNYMLKRGSVIAILVLFAGLSLLPSLGGIIVKNSENLNNIYIEKSPSGIDWWSKFHHDLNNSGYSSSPYGPETNNIIWTYPTDFQIICSPAVINNKVYIGSDDEYFYCLDTITGALIWRNEIPGGTSVSSPCIVDGRVYVGTTYDHVFCWDSDTGEEIWRFYKGYGSSRSPAIYDGNVYISFNPINNTNFYGKICCLNAYNGSEIWNRTFFDGTINHVALYEGKVLVPHYLGRLYCLDGETGETIWDANTGGAYGAPAIINGKVYASADGIKCLDVNNGDEIWHYPGNWSYCSPAVAYNKVYYLSSDGKVICLDADTGNEVWTYVTGSDYEHAFTSPAVADEKVYVGICSNGNLICFNASNGNILWKYQVSPGLLFSSPAIANGRLYIGSTLTYKVYCFGNPSSPPNPPIINGPTNGKVDVSLNYTFNSIDPDGDDVYYYIKWGDGYIIEWDGPLSSGMDFKITHTYTERGNYTIEAKALDGYGYESDWATLEVTIPRTRASSYLWYQLFLERFPLLERLLKFWLL